MKKEKTVLTLVVVLAIVGGVFASKVSRVNRTFYAIGSTVLYGQQTFACIVPVNLPRAPHPLGGLTPFSSTYNSTPTTTCTCRVLINI